MPRRFVTLYLGTRELKALSRCPASMKRGRWINLIAAQLVRWNPREWETLLHRLAPPPRSRTSKLNVSLPADLADELDSKRGHVPLTDVLRTALLLTAKEPYRHVPAVPKLVPSSADRPTPGASGDSAPGQPSSHRWKAEWREVAVHLHGKLRKIEEHVAELEKSLEEADEGRVVQQSRIEDELTVIRSAQLELKSEVDELNSSFMDWISFRTGVEPEEDSYDDD